jgi:hypothetical protein
MKKSILLLIAATLLSVLGACNFLMGPDEAFGNDGGNLSISFGTGGGNGRTAGSRAALSDEVLAALRYELTLRGPGDAVLERTVSGTENLRLTVALGEWRIDANAYQQEGLVGTGGLAFTVTSGLNSIRIPMTINGGYFDIIIEGPRDEAVTVRAVHSGGESTTTISRRAGESLVFTLDSSDYTAEAENLLWIVEGRPKTGSRNSLTINAVDYVERSYSLTVMIKVNDQWYSAETGFTVAE